MSGIFTKANRPRRPGAYFNFEAVAAASIPVSTGATVAVSFTHDWGPFKTATKLNSFADFVAVFGPTTTTAGYKAVKQIFQGEGVDGRGGAGAVVAYRMGATAAAKSVITLTNTNAATPALRLRARYEGTYGNNLKVTTQDWLTDPAGGTSTQNELIIFNGTVEVERYRYLDTDIANLAVQINANSDWITADGPGGGAIVTGVALTAVTSSAFISGNSGDLLILGADMTAMRSALEVERFGIYVHQDIAGEAYSGTTASAEITATKTWAVGTTAVPGLNMLGKRFEVVLGGALNETLAGSFTARGAINDENFTTLAIGSVRDNNILDTAGVGTILSTSQLAPRWAGILAYRGQSLSGTSARLQGVDIVVGPTENEILRAFDYGFVVLSKDSNATAPVKIEKALTTYVTTTDTNKPYLVYRNPKFVLTMQGLETELTEFAQANVIGLLTVNDKTREALVGEMKARLQQRADASIIQSGFTVEVDPDPPATNDDEFIALRYSIKFGRSVEQVFNLVRIA